MGALESGSKDMHLSVFCSVALTRTRSRHLFSSLIEINLREFIPRVGSVPLGN